MSIILKGIDMPKDGEIYHINIYDNGNTYIITSNILYKTEMKDIEAIQIPTPHGRLIDGDYLQEVLESNKCPESLVFDFIKSEPTILEAEE